ncbi:amidohydrolase family protein [Flavobacteriaceae bacterium R38]|nr:amidohydrolase family protein [Flavobacteriaceae bacterium R38]
MNKYHLILFFFFTLLINFSNAQVKALQFESLITGDGKVIDNAIVVIKGDRVINVGKENEIQIPEKAEIIDLKSYTAIPGLIDAHTHITYYWDQTPGSRPWSQLGTFNPAVTVFLAQENAYKALETGVTTVRDLGSFANMDFSMRDLINRGKMKGPRLFIAGRGLSNRRTKGVAEVEKFAQEQIDAGADWIKVYGSTGSANDLTGTQTFNYDEMKAAVNIAHKAGKRISIHSYGPDGARDAVKAGTNTLEHAINIDDATLKAMSKQGTIYVPTVDHNRYYAAHKDEYGYTDDDVKNLNEFIQKNFQTVKKAIAANVKIAMGSDAVFTGFGENTKELEWFVKAGMSPAQALETATTIGAEMLGMENDLGTIAPGYYADIVAVKGNPLKDINVIINNVKWVMKGGEVMVDKTRE